MMQQLQSLFVGIVGGAALCGGSSLVLWSQEGRDLFSRVYMFSIQLFSNR